MARVYADQGAAFTSGFASGQKMAQSVIDMRTKAAAIAAANGIGINEGVSGDTQAALGLPADSQQAAQLDEQDKGLGLSGVQSTVDALNSNPPPTPAPSAQQAAQLGTQNQGLGQDATSATTDALNSDAASQPSASTAGLASNYSVGGKSFDTQDAANAYLPLAQADARAKVYTDAGDWKDGALIRSSAQDMALTGLKLQEAQGKMSDDDELRQALTAGQPQPSGGAGSTAANGAATATDGTAADGVATSPTTLAKPGQTTSNDLDGYLKNVAPKAIATLLQQGKVTDAKNFGDFVNSEHGKAYAAQWMQGVRKHAIGDNAGALQDFQKLYNDQMYNDGHTMTLTPLADGKTYQADQFDPNGNKIWSNTEAVDDLAAQGALALEPTKAVEFMAKQQASTAQNAALLDRQQQRDDYNANRDGLREDRSDARLQTTLDAQAKRAEGTGGLTLAQQRDNAEIDSARKTVSGLSADEIRSRTAKTTDTGRDNPSYDPQLSRAMTLANRRKVGADDSFDGSQTQQSTQNAGLADVAKRFRSDHKMLSYRLGNNTPGGVEVLDKSGKVIGHYQ